MACMRHSRDHDEAKFLVFRSKPSSDAPFKINSEAGIEIHDREDISVDKMEQQIARFSPDIIFISGWTNKKYLNLAKAYKNKGLPVIVGMDNHWKGTLKQHIAGFLSPWYIKHYFTDIWIPGSPQYKFAKRLGFNDKQIHQGLYCANEELFKGKPKSTKKKEVLFVGRMVAHKGVPQLIGLIENLIAQDKLNLRFHFVGNGPLTDRLPKHENIKHTPFIAPEKLPQVLEETGFFILPSTYEAWGVVVQEALLMGTPVISTHQCGAAIDLVEHTKNGFLFDAGSFDELQTILEKIEVLSDQEYATLSENALSTAKKIDHNRWSQTFEKIVKK